LYAMTAEKLTKGNFLIIFRHFVIKVKAVCVTQATITYQKVVSRVLYLSIPHFGNEIKQRAVKRFIEIMESKVKTLFLVCEELLLLSERFPSCFQIKLFVPFLFLLLCASFRLIT
jgi:hypothetical protein